MQRRCKRLMILNSLKIMNAFFLFFTSVSLFFFILIFSISRFLFSLQMFPSIFFFSSLCHFKKNFPSVLLFNSISLSLSLSFYLDFCFCLSLSLFYLSFLFSLSCLSLKSLISLSYLYFSLSFSRTICLILTVRKLYRLWSHDCNHYEYLRGDLPPLSLSMANSPSHLINRSFLC